MIVCIAEKPSVAKDIAKVLGANTQHDGYLEGNGYQVTWTFGHLCGLKEPHDYTPLWKSWSLSRLPMIPEHFGIKLIDDKGIAKQFATIERLMQAADSIVNCGDAGQEGELIQRWVMQKARATCPVQRLWISSLTEEAIREGFNNLKPQSDYTSLYEAGLCRAIGDWLLGMNCTRLYTLKYRQQQRQVLSIGRVQTPTLALIVNRQLEIQNFVPEQYFVLSTLYRDVLFNATVGKYQSREEAEKALTSIGGVMVRTGDDQVPVACGEVAEPPFEVTDVQTKKGSESAPRLFDLTSLQVDCNKKFSFSADKTLQLIQSLYEKKVTTYPRVDTTFLSDDIYPKCPQILSGLQPYAALTAPLAGKKLPKSKKVFDSSKVTDHHAIIPTGVNPANVGLSYEEKKVFDLVARRFIAVFYPDCKFLTTTVLGAVDGTNAEGEQKTIEFKATGKQIEDAGWRAVFEWGRTQKDVDEEEEKKDDEEKMLPAFKKGESGPHRPTLAEKWTTPPKPYTEATLLRAMETAGKMVDDDELRDAMKENGIGRPSTRAAIIETLFRRGYIRKERKSLSATQTGVGLIGIIREELLKSAELTGRWEKKLREIEYHKYDAHQFLDELKGMVGQIVQEVMMDNSNRRVASVEETKPAKKSGSAKSEGSKGAAKTTSKSDAPKKPRKKATKKKDEMVRVKEGDVCPLCGKGTIIRGRTALGCSEWKAGCGFRQALEE